jgi:hypothetical protein
MDADGRGCHAGTGKEDVMATKKHIRVDPDSAVVDPSPPDLLSLSGRLLAEVNRELDARFMELPEDVRALLVQKGALTQMVIRELTRLIDQAAAKAEKHDDLLDKCEGWLEDFFLPLQAQSDGKPVAKSIYLKDLENMIEEFRRVLEEREG